LAELVRRWKEFRMLTPCLDSVGEWMGGLSHHFWITLRSDRSLRLNRFTCSARREWTKFSQTWSHQCWS